MYNMSYCRWENTLGAFKECIHSAQTGEELSSSYEVRAAKAMLSEMVDFLYDVGILDDYPDDVEDRIAEFVEDMTEESA